MSDAENYDDILDRSWDDIPETQVLPVGSYRLKVRNVNYQPPREEGKSGRVLFFYEAEEPMDDVDAKELKALGDNYDIADNDIVAQFWVDRNKDWDKVRTHMGRHGIDVSGMTMKESFEAIRGGEIIAYLNQRTYEDRNGEMVTTNEPTDFAEIE